MIDQIWRDLVLAASDLADEQLADPIDRTRVEKKFLRTLVKARKVINYADTPCSCHPQVNFDLGIGISSACEKHGRFNR